MNIEELILGRRTIHNYSDKPVADTVIRRALELALWAPNHKLTMPWQFTLVGPEARTELAKLSLALKETKKGTAFDAEQRLSLQAEFLRPSHLVAVSMKRNGDARQEREDYAAVAGGLENAALYLWSLGIGTKWSTSPLIRDKNVYSALRINSETEEMVGLLWIGYPDKVPQSLRKVDLGRHLRHSP